MGITTPIPGHPATLSTDRPPTKDEILAAIDAVHAQLLVIRRMAETLLTCEVRDIGSDELAGRRAFAPPKDS
jgi:hypothetical protein